MKKFLRLLMYLFLVCLIALITFLATLFLGGFGKIPSKTELLSLKNESASLVLSKSGQPIGKFFSENRTNVAYDSLPETLIQALIATEDARFYEHKGVDGKALIRVLLKTIILNDRKSGGGSTLSQQLAKNLFGRKDYGKITIGVNKLKEIILANRLEEIYNKEEIVELYFNTVPFGENVYGIEVAAQRFFSVSVSELSTEQAAVLVGILKANTKFNPRLHPKNALERRNTVLLQMNKNGYLNNQQLDSLLKIELQISYSNLALNGKAPYFMQQLKPELDAILKEIEKTTGKKYDYKKDGLQITSTLDQTLQLAGKKAIDLHLSKMQTYMDHLYGKGKSRIELVRLAEKLGKRKQVNLEDTTSKNRTLFQWDKTKKSERKTIKDSLLHTLKQLHAGILGLNPKNGAILTWIGGIDFSYYPFDQVVAKRQLASTFKPFLYANSLRFGRTPCDYLSNEAIVLNDYDNWSPKNYDGNSGGSYSLAAALAYSKNLPTVHLYFETEQEQLKALWNKLGFIDQLNDGPSVILGTNSVSMLELAVAYSVFANGGKLINPYTIENIKDESGEIIYQKTMKKFSQVLEQKVTAQINSILKKAINEGTGASIRHNYKINLPLAGKTGTSQDYADAWFVGYNRKLLLISRVGASYPNIHFKTGKNGSGSKLALPLVALTLKEALKNDEFESSMQNAQLTSFGPIECPDFKEKDLIDKIFQVFKKNETNLETEQKRAKKKKKVKGILKSIFKK